MLKRKGFTLVELVMVIVILGILAAVAIPTFFNLQDQARAAACRGALGGLRSGISIWYAKTAASGRATWPTLGDLTAVTDGVMASGIIPENPYTGRITIWPGTGEMVCPGEFVCGWIYDVNTGRIFSAAPQTVGSNW